MLEECLEVSVEVFLFDYDRKLDTKKYFCIQDLKEKYLTQEEVRARFQKEFQTCLHPIHYNKGKTINDMPKGLRELFEVIERLSVRENESQVTYEELRSVYDSGVIRIKNKELFKQIYEQSTKASKHNTYPVIIKIITEKEKKEIENWRKSEQILQRKKALKTNLKRTYNLDCEETSESIKIKDVLFRKLLSSVYVQEVRRKHTERDIAEMKKQLNHLERFIEKNGEQASIDLQDNYENMTNYIKNKYEELNNMRPTIL